jgi:hypothetical protein
MRRTLLALAAAIALFPAGGASATSYGPRTAHDPRLGCKAIKQVVADLNAGRLADPDSWRSGPTFYSDAFGEVEDKEEEAFVHAMRHSEGRPDEKPIRLGDVTLIHKDRHDPIYLVELDREAWHETRDVDDGMGDVQKVDDPHYATDHSYWLVSFGANEISDFREAFEMFPLRKNGIEQEHCY